MRLYELATEWRNALDHCIDADTGEVRGDLEAALDELGDSIEAKVDAVVKLRVEALAEASAFKAEAARCAARRKAAEARAERLRGYLGLCLDIMSVDKVKTSTHTVARRDNPPSVALDCDVENLPPEFQVAQAPKADRKTLLALLKAGDEEAARYAHLETSKRVDVR